MRKKKYSRAAGMLLLLLLLLPVWGSRAKADTGSEAANGARVTDEADLLSAEEEGKLNESIRSVINAYDFDVAILTVQGLGGKTAQAYADDYYDANGYGMGADRDGILFLVSMESRDYAISTHGYGIDAFTDYGLQKIEEKVVPKLSDGEYYKSFRQFVSMAETFLEEAREGEPFDGKNPYKEPANYALRELVALMVSLLIGLTSVLVMKQQMNTARPGRYAGTYVREGSFRLTKERDTFLYSQVAKVKKPEMPENGGSTTHQSSSGSTHGGSSGKF